MGYKYSYQTVGKRRYPMTKPLPRWTVFAVVTAVCFLAITIYNGSANWLLPGDPEVTESAIKEMIARLSDGEAFGEAVTAFCREIVAGAR